MMPTTVSIPSDLDPINAAIADLQKRVAALEAQPAPTPIPPPSGASPDGTWHTAATDPAIVDDAGNAYTLVATAGKGLQIAKNAAIDPPTQNVTRLGILSRKVHQQNSAGGWWVDTQPGKTNTTAWVAEADPTAPPTPTPSGAFRVSGGRIVDSNGNPFRAKGINLLYRQVWGNGQVDLGRISRQHLQASFPGINFIRFACCYGTANDPPPGDAATLAWIKDMTGNGIVVLMDLHYTGDAVSPSDATANGWFNGWSKLLANNPMVWWDTQNEPHGGGTAISAMQLGQYNAIRSGGSQSPVLLCLGNPGPEMTSMNQADFAGMSNAGFDCHYYGWVPNSGTNWQGLLSELSGYRSKDGAMPVLCCEFGDSTDGNVRDANWQQVISEATGNPAGFAAWFCNWSSAGADNLLASPYDGSALTDYGSLVMSAIKSG